MDDVTIARSKADLRDRMKRARDAIDPASRLERAERIQASAYSVPGFAEAEAIGLYWASASEVLTIGLAIRLAEQEQRRILLPFVLNGELQLSEWQPANPVVDAEYGGMHPRYRRAVALDEVDALIVPGLAFDHGGRRLGSGTGHYDRLLARISLRTTRIAFCFDEQIVEDVPAGSDDEGVHFLVSDRGVVRCSPSNATPTG